MEMTVVATSKNGERFDACDHGDDGVDAAVMATMTIGMVADEACMTGIGMNRARCGAATHAAPNVRGDFQTARPAEAGTGASREDLLREGGRLPWPDVRGRMSDDEVRGLAWWSITIGMHHNDHDPRNQMREAYEYNHEDN